LVIMPDHTDEPGFKEFWDGLWNHKAWEHDKVYDRACKAYSCGYQHIAFPEDIWEPKFQRVLINTRGMTGVLGNLTWTEKNAPEPSRVGKNDIEQWIGGDEEWIVERD